MSKIQTKDTGNADRIRQAQEGAGNQQDAASLLDDLLANPAAGEKKIQACW